MSYIVNQDIIDRVGTAKAAELTADTGSTPDQTVLDEVRQSAEGEANGYLARRYDVPVDLTEHPELAATLKGVVLDVAVYRLTSRRPPAQEAYRQNRDDAVTWLEKVSKGEIVLPAASTPASSEADNPVHGHGSQAQNLSTIREDFL